MGTDKPRYFVSIKGCFYWRPTPRMKRAGFRDRALGKNKLAAMQEAMRLNAEWDRHRFGERVPPNIMVYPPGSLGQAYGRALALREAERKSKGIAWTRQQRARDDWPRAWRWIGPAFGDYDPLAVVSEDLLALRAKVAERVSESEAFRVIKVWRALWAKLTPLGYTVPPGSDPSLTFTNSAPPPRQEVWPQRDVLRLVQRAWREHYYGLAALLAVAWDTMLSPIDVRSLTGGQRGNDGHGSVFALERAKTGRAAAGTLSRWSEAILDAYLAKLGLKLHDAAPLFWTRGGTATAKGGRPWPSRPYTSDRLGIDFRHIRALVFGPGDERQIQDMRRSGAVEAMRGDAAPTKLSTKMANTIASSNRLHRTYIPVDVAAVRDVDKARAIGRERNRGKMLQLHSAKKLQPKSPT
jgi:hypothetical protein